MLSFWLTLLPKKGETASKALKLSPSKAQELGVIDGTIEEPIGGAHRDHQKVFETMKNRLSKELDSLAGISPEELTESRFKKFRNMGNETICQVNFDSH